MKKLLLASAALALSAGVASAQGIAISGDARMGLDYDDQRGLNIAPGQRGRLNTSQFQFTSRARILFTLSGQTDTGMSFGAALRADNSVAATGNTTMNGGNVFISGTFGTLRMGDVAGAARHLVGDLAFTSLTGIGDWNEMGYLDRFQQQGFFDDDNTETLDISARRTAVRYDYTIDALTLSVSLDQLRRLNDAPQADGTVVNNTRVSGYSLAASYDWAINPDMSVVLSAGWESLLIDRGRFVEIDPVTGARTRVGNASNSNAGHWILGAEFNAWGVDFKGIYGEVTGDVKNALKDAGLVTNQWGLSASAGFDEWTVSAFYNAGFLRNTQMGIGAAYDLGGGASIIGSVAYQQFIPGVANLGALSERIATGDQPRGRKGRTRADLGVAMRF